MIDFHGLVLCLTRSTCVDRSICLPFCTRSSSSDRFARLTLSGGGAGLPDHPGERKALGSGCSPALPAM